MDQAERTKLAFALLDTADALRAGIGLVDANYAYLSREPLLFVEAATIAGRGPIVLAALQTLAYELDRTAYVEGAKARVAAKRAARRAAEVTP